MVSVVPERLSARAVPGWAVDGVTVAARSDLGWVEGCGCVALDSERWVHKWADARAVTFSMAAVARSVVVMQQVLGEKSQDVAFQSKRRGKASTIYIVGVRAKNHGRTLYCQLGLNLNRPPVPR